MNDVSMTPDHRTIQRLQMWLLDTCLLKMRLLKMRLLKMPTSPALSMSR